MKKKIDPSESLNKQLFQEPTSLLVRVLPQMKAICDPISHLLLTFQLINIYSPNVCFRMRIIQISSSTFTCITVNLNEKYN